MAQSQLVHSFREFAYMFERWCAKDSIPGTEAVKQQPGLVLVTVEIGKVVKYKFSFSCVL